MINNILQRSKIDIISCNSQIFVELKAYVSEKGLPYIHAKLTKLEAFAEKTIKVLQNFQLCSPNKTTNVFSTKTLFTQSILYMWQLKSEKTQNTGLSDHTFYFVGIMDENKVYGDVLFGKFLININY